MSNVKFISVKLKSTFLALENKNALTLYWIEQTQELFKGDKLFGTGALASEQAAGLLSAEDYAKLQSLIASGFGLNNLVPVDGSILIAKDGDNTTIGAKLSAADGNMLAIKEDGLYVTETKVPEYSIERQDVAEDGYSASYRLKRTLDGVSTYVGDPINLFKDLMISKGSLETVVTNGVPYDSAVVGDPYIDLVLNDAEASHIYIPVKGLVDVYSAGSGIAIEIGIVSVKLANDTSGLRFVDGALDLALATKNSNGAMSKEDKLVVDSIPYVYEARKYDISGTPTGTLVNYGEREIRVMVPADAEFNEQNVGAGGDPNTYYMTLRTYAPNNAVGYKEHIGNQSDSEVLTNLSTDEYGRKYQSTWLGLARLDKATGTWSYYGKNSSAERFVGWNYQIDWYTEDGVMVANDSIRINLSNEECHNLIRPYYGQDNDLITEIVELQNTIAEMQEMYSWSEM